MSVIQVEDLVSYQLRSNYLNTVKDGVGERLITLNDAFLNTPGFKAAGWRQNPSHVKRTHSPPIPTAITSEYFKAPRFGLRPGSSHDEFEEGGMVTGEGAGDTMGPGIATKRRRRREQMEEEDSSDLSDDSDEEEQRAAQQIKFAKMPVRLRSGSSPIRNSNSKGSPNMTSPPRQPGARRGSQSAVEAVKERARRDTVTSSEMSSENEFDNSGFKRQQAQGKVPPKAGRRVDRSQDEMEDYSYVSDMSSDFGDSVDSQSILGSVEGRTSTSLNHHAVGTLPRSLAKMSLKKSKPAPAILQALPPPRPISFIQPKSLLSAAISAKRTKAAMPFEKFASYSGRGDPNPLRLRIWAPFASSSETFYEVLIRRTIHGGEGGDRQVTVADLIGLSLNRYAEEKKEPVLAAKQLNVNRWTLRLIEDDEVDYDFPALDRTKPVVAFTTVNNKVARSRSGSSSYDEFALVEATEEQFKENEQRTPQFQQESPSSTGDDEFIPVPKVPSSAPSTAAPTPSPRNPVITTMPNIRSNTLADMPAAPIRGNAAPSGAQKLLRIHIHSLDASPGQLVTLNVATTTYLAEVLDIVCKKRHLDKANHVLKHSGSGTVVLLDRTVESIGARTDLDLSRRRFATDGPLTMSGSPASTSPRTPLRASFDAPSGPALRKMRKGAAAPTGMAGSPMHPLAREAMKQDEEGNPENFRKYVVWRRQPMRFVGMNERLLVIDGEYLHIMPGPSGKTLFEGKGEGKTTTVHFSNVVGCKVTRRHPTNFKVVLYRATETKRYDFEARNADEAAEIVFELKKGLLPYHES
ncbi:hypothetical protein VF21_01474 [Pseudogymnoascus sp. 05NY08]|nr:hypothetical protein VF21_01474 [Pseudogymnoascus sp. 05NY08]